MAKTNLSTIVAESKTFQKCIPRWKDVNVAQMVAEGKIWSKIERYQDKKDYSAVDVPLQFLKSNWLYDTLVMKAEFYRRK